LPRNLHHFLESGEPPIYFGFGSTRAPEDAGPTMIRAARELGRRAIVSQGWFDDSLVQNERDCLSIGEVNVHGLFPRVAAVVDHGGAGTTTAAALAGAPTRDSLASALAQSLRPEVAVRTRTVAGTARRDGTRVAAERLVALE
jgi:vancomycin aglycone glucosyltransferase